MSGPREKKRGEAEGVRARERTARLGYSLKSGHVAFFLSVRTNSPLEHASSACRRLSLQA